jgi:Asp-tRNA(Asn)/Glu-tRNA(Gln) amidotransferase A subunit family amidase
MLQYDINDFKMKTYFDATREFSASKETPRTFLESCLEQINARDPEIKAFVTLQPDEARRLADKSSQRWANNQQLSVIDGMPIGIKDLLETSDMPTQMGCEAYKGFSPGNDNALVSALRNAGAIILGKTVTAELGGSHPGPTKNPFDLERTPGGSSSGSAAAVAASMVPVAIGSQVGGSIIRPAGYCGNFALKPSQGGLHRGERQTTSMSTHGPHAGSIEDMWQVAIEIARRTGGDPGYIGLQGPNVPPKAIKPSRLIFIETEGWSLLDPKSKEAFNILLSQLESNGITIIKRSMSHLVEQLEQTISNAGTIANSITSWENHWGHRNLVTNAPEGVSQRLKNVLAKAELMTPEDYNSFLLLRSYAREAHKFCASLADATITLSCPGPAPLWEGDKDKNTLAARPTGDPIFNFASSIIGAPCVTIPMLSVNNLPVGVQIIAQREQDAWATSLAKWIYEKISPVSID